MVHIDSHQPRHASPGIPDDIYNSANEWAGNNGKWTNEYKILSLNIIETKRTYHVSILVPGQDPDELRIIVEGDKITVTNAKENDDVFSTDDNYSFATFTRSFTTLQEIDRDKIKAIYEDDVIKITLVKKPRSVRVKRKSQNKIHLHFTDVS